MKKTFNIFCCFLLLLVAKGTLSQVRQPFYPDTIFSTYYLQRVSHFLTLPQTKEDIIFIGNSIIDGGEWGELFYDLRVKNRGISGDNTTGVLNRLSEVYNRKPDKVFLLIGINDLSRNIAVDSIAKNIIWITALLKDRSPLTKIYVQSIFPVNEKFGKFGGHTSKRNEILQLNKVLFDNAVKYNYKYIDVFLALADTTGRLNTEFTNDGLHLTGLGYLKWKEIVYDKVYDLPALIPYPKKINWNKERYSLKNYTAIYINNPLFQKEARNLQKFLASKNISVQIKVKLDPEEKAIELWMKDSLPNANKEESYSLTVSANAIKVESETPHGLYNAIQTFKQLSEGNVISGCEIYDSPAFSWRGFMIDVGRNYQSVSQIKQQIDVMAAYKLNIFHFHLTEDIAWRLQSKKYPQLTDAKYMLRNPGKYYSIEEMKDLINYCNERYITLVPEIDMPGHSAAFKRAMGVDMQSEKGTIICKNILTEICDELNVPIIHIGGDEVKITNHDFLPQMTKLLLSKNKQVIAWNPGGVLPEGTTLQMWNGGTKPKTKYPSVDSRHLYLNHFDPIDGVVATFNHKICDTVSGDDFKLGATLCNWPDRNVTNETDLIDMNAVYPILLTFSERCWAGGGWENYATDIGIPGSEKYISFKNFEARLLTHKEIYFNKLSFPYFKQSNIEWSLIGPFDNNGNTSKPFFIENIEHLDSIQKINTLKVYGGTIWLRHFWDPMIKSHLSKQNDSVTYYAVTKIWSEKAETKNFWIGFDNLSRSTATDSPPLNEWDERNSKVWVNNKIIAPPIWARAGQKGDSEIPLIDENYEIRPPTKILLKAGWNYVLIKSPVASFKAKDWQNPVKWMFSFIPQ